MRLMIRRYYEMGKPRFVYGTSHDGASIHDLTRALGVAPGDEVFEVLINTSVPFGKSSGPLVRGVNHYEAATPTVAVDLRALPDGGYGVAL